MTPASPPSNGGEGRIAMLAPDLSLGGAERVFVTLANAFVERGRAVDVVLVKGEGHFLKQLDARCRVSALGQQRVATALRPLLRYLESRRPRAVLSIHTRLNVLAVLANGLSSHDTRVVVAEHALLHAVQETTTMAKERWAIRSTRLAYLRAHAVVAVSEAAARSIERTSGLGARHITVIPNPVVSQVGVTEGRSVHPWLADGGPPVVLSLGRLEEEKSLDTLIRAVHDLQGRRAIRLLVVGEGALRPRLEGLVRELGVSDLVDLPGAVTNPLDHLAAADVLASTSRFESFGNSIVEALSVGTQVVSTGRKGAPGEILGAGRFGVLTSAGDVEAIAEGIGRALDHPIPPALLQQRAQDFTEARIVPRYLDLLGA